MNISSCVDLIITYSPNSFQNTSTFCTGLFDFYALAVTVLKTSIRKTAPKEFHYRDYYKFNVDDFKTELKQILAVNSSSYKSLNKHLNIIR